MLGGFLRRNFPKPDYSFRAHPSTPKGMITEHLKQLRHAHEDRLEGIWRIGKLARHQDAVNVLTVSCETANLAINGHENFKKTGIPFYLGIGEHHHKPLHHIHNMAASENIRKEGIPHTKSHELDLSYLLDQLQSRVADKLDRPITEDEASYIRKKAEGSSIYMKLHTLDTEVDSRYNYAPYTGIRTRSAHLSRLIDSGITVKLTDAPIIPESREEDKCYIQTDKPDIHDVATLFRTENV